MINGFIESQQERDALAKVAENTGNIATVSAFDAEKGVQLILPSAATAGGKWYPYNASCTFKAGDRVHIVRESGTIIVEYPIGGAN